MTPAHAEQALDALAFIENVIEANPINWGWILDHTTADDLMVGLASLSKSLILSLAANTGESWQQVVEAQRFLLMQASTV